MNEQPYNDHHANREPFRKVRGENRHERRAQAKRERQAQRAREQRERTQNAPTS